MPGDLLILMILLLPLAAFVLLAFWGKYLQASAGIIGICSMLLTFVVAAFTAWKYFFAAGMVQGVYRPLQLWKFTWLAFTPDLSIDLSLLLDPIAIMMIVVVTFISLMVQVFSLAYMKEERRFSTYYAYLSLFSFSMLGLVLSGNIFQVYIFWELVGISSYLLISFYFDKPAAVSAAKKAFIVTRFADLGFLIGILVLAFYSGTLDLPTLMERLSGATPQLAQGTAASFLGVSALTWALVLIFIGGAGKSAMFPLHIWLPDAMEGPTPVSALIHAATMVVAGVYLVARLFPVFAGSDPSALHLVMYTGAFSAIFAAVIACTQTDIKRVLAYSTMSQIGYMMFALGVSGYHGEAGLGFSASMFHLFTHAFFKSLLFLCAGVVIHVVHSNDMRDMGGLRKFMPVTHACFLVACLAIAGVPPFSGFFSKEEILLAAFKGNIFIYVIALVTSGLTAFYMFRLYFSVFWSREQGEALAGQSHREGGLAMKMPLVILAVCTLLAGFVPFAVGVTADGVPLQTHLHLVFSIAPVLLASVGIAIAAYLYKTGNDSPRKLSVSLGAAYRLVYRKFYIDEMYSFITKKIIFNGIGKPAAWVDKYIVDGGVNFIASITAGFSKSIRQFQSGKLQQYSLYFFAGIAGLVLYFVLIKS